MPNDSDLLEEETCGYELHTFCEPCDRDLPHLCLDGVVTCPVCLEAIGCCPDCVGEGLTDA